MSNSVIYEYPLHERMRSILRLEHLLSQLQYFNTDHAASWESRAAIATLIELMEMFTRSDLKTELIKELERASQNLARHLEHPGVDADRLTKILRSIDECAKALHNIKGQLGQALKSDEFLSTIRQRTTIPGGTCDFDLPVYHLWLSRNAVERQRRINDWLTTVEPIRNAIELILKLLRGSAVPRQETAIGGNFQKNLDTATPYQMLRIGLPVELDYYPEISGGKHRFNIRFMEPGESRAKQIKDDVAFMLNCCNL